MITLTISARERRDVMDAKAEAALADATFPLEVTLKNETSRALILPEVGLKLSAADKQTLTLQGDKRLRRLISNLAQIAHLVKAAPLATLTLVGDSASRAAPAAPPKVPAPAARPVPPTPAPAPEPAAKPAPDQVRVIRDDDEAYVVELDGVQFEPQRNQVRDDGTLTPGGKRAFADAKKANKQRAN